MADERIEQRDAKPELRVVDGQEATPEGLARRALSSPEALEELCDRYIGKIYSFILKRVGNVQDAEDITSIVFEKVIVNLASFDESRASFTTWIYRIALNSVTDHFRSRGRRRELSLDDGSTSLSAVADDEAARADAGMLLIDMLKELPPRYREAVSLRYFAGLKVQEVAETLGITESAASKRILRGLEELRRLAGDRLPDGRA